MICRALLLLRLVTCSLVPEISLKERESSLSLDRIVNDLNAQAYSTIPFDASKEEIDSLIDSFISYTDLADEEKHFNAGDICKLSDTRRCDIGYHKRKQSEGHDEKEFFHYHPFIKKFQNGKYLDIIEENIVVKQFIDKADAIYNKVIEKVKEICLLFGQEVYNKVFLTKEDENIHIFLRFLRYPKGVGEQLAAAHQDAGSMTLAIAESMPGLRIGFHSSQLKEIEHKDEQAIFFLSGNREKLLGDSSLPIGIHDVIRKDGADPNKNYNRWALVAFIDGINFEVPPAAENRK